MVSFLVTVACCVAVMQISSAQLLSSNNVGNKLGKSNFGLNSGLANNYGLKSQGSSGNLVCSNVADSKSGKVTGTIGTRIVNSIPGNIQSLVNKEVGVQIVAQDLTAGGSLDVKGQLPLYATVAVNGKVPSEGVASVKYECGGNGN